MTRIKLTSIGETDGDFVGRSMGLSVGMVDGIALREGRSEAKRVGPILAVGLSLGVTD